MKAKKYYEVLDEAESIIRDYPESPAGYAIMAEVLAKLNDMPAAYENLKEALMKGFPDDNEHVRTFVTPELLANKLVEGFYTGPLDRKNGYRPVVTRKDSLQGGIRPERACFDVTFYDLNINVNPDARSIAGVNQIHFTILEATDKIQVDLTDTLQIHGIFWNGTPLSYIREENALFIKFPEILSPGDKESISISYSGAPRIAPNPPWNGGFVWGKKGGKHWIGVACEHLGASCWWPNKDHLSDEPDSMKITITTPPKYIAISNGNLIRQEKSKSKCTYEWFVSYPINNYAVTLYIGDFINLSELYTCGNRSYTIDYYVYPSNRKKAEKYFQHTQAIVREFEELFGPYPFPRDGIGLVEAPYTGMENQGAIAIGDDYGKTPRRSYEQFDYDYLLVHELAHEWWGNGVTMNDMADAWISEGFATYAEALLMEKSYGNKVYNEIISEDMAEIINIWPVVGKRNINDNSFLSGDIYHKGAIILHNLRCILDNDSLFFSLIKQFCQKYVYKTVSTHDFVCLVIEMTGKDLSSFFDQFLNRKEPPVLTYNVQKEKGNFYFSYKWTGVRPDFAMPFLLVTNDTIQHRLMGTTAGQILELKNVRYFYIANQNKYPENLGKNAMTYFWTHLNSSADFKKK